MEGDEVKIGLLDALRSGRNMDGGELKIGLLDALRSGPPPRTEICIPGRPPRLERQERTVFELEEEEEGDGEDGKPARPLHKSLSVRGTLRRKSTTKPSIILKTESQAERNRSQEVSLQLMWTGQWEQARLHHMQTRQLRKKEDEVKEPSVLVKEDPIRSVQEAENEFLRFWFVGDPTVAGEVIFRLQEAEQLCHQRSRDCATLLSEELAKLNKKKPFWNRAVRRLSTTSRTLGATPGEIHPGTLERDVDRANLAEWKRLQGLAALCVVLVGVTQMMSGAFLRGAMTLRRAWRICMKADTTGASESATYFDISLQLVIAWFRIAMTLLPPWVLGFLRATTSGLVGDVEKGEAALLHIMRNADPLGEPGNYARLTLAAYQVTVSTQEYRADRSALLKQADALLDTVLTLHSDWIMYQWMRSHVNRRLGRMQSAIATVKELRTRVQSQLRRTSLRLTMDLATLYFANRHWMDCQQLLEGLLEPPVGTDSEIESFDHRIHAMVMLSACEAMQGNIISAVGWLETAEKCQPSQSVQSKTDYAWLRKLRTLYYRPHKRVLAYEIAYIFGYMKWFDVDVVASLRAGGKDEATVWMIRTRSDLREMHNEATVSTVYPDLPLVTSQDAAEELLVVSLMSGAVSATLGELVEAEKHFQHVLDNAGTKSAREGTSSDPWHTPFALYELGSMEIRRGGFMAARTLLRRSMVMCSKRNFSFHHLLAAKCRNALRFISNEFAQARGDPKFSLSRGLSFLDVRQRKDELGSWLSGIDESMETSMVPDPNEPSNMIPVLVNRHDQFQIKRRIKKGETVSWRWTVETHDIGFRVDFTSKSVMFGDEDVGEDSSLAWEEVNAYERFETGDMVQGFHTAHDLTGVVRFTWDNTTARYTDKRVHYAVWIRGSSS